MRLNNRVSTAIPETAGRDMLCHCSLVTVHGGNQQAKFAAFTKSGISYAFSYHRPSHTVYQIANPMRVLKTYRQRGRRSSGGIRLVHRRQIYSEQHYTPPHETTGEPDFNKHNPCRVPRRQVRLLRGDPKRSDPVTDQTYTGESGLI